jgi:hypothetical protein
VTVTYASRRDEATYRTAVDLALEPVAPRIEPAAPRSQPALSGGAT